jgi:hypothetical protein
MRPLFPESVEKNNKKTNLGRYRHGGVAANASPNLLYKRIVISAASPRGKIADNLGAASDCGFLPPGSGSGAEAGRSSAEARHDSAKHRAEEKIHR